MTNLLNSLFQKKPKKTLVEINTEYTIEGHTTDEVFEINWTLGNVCNYSCSYCPNFKHDASMIVKLGDPERSRISWLLNSIKEQTGINFFLFNFSGGEPTRVPGFTEFCSWLKSSHSARILVNTNASRPMSFWRENWSNFDRISMSFHAEFADVDSFLEKYVFLSDRLHAHVALMMHPIKWNKCIELANRLKKLEVFSFSYGAIFEGWPNQSMEIDRRYTDEQLDFLRKNKGTISSERRMPVENFSRRFITKWNDGEVTDNLSKQDLINKSQNNFKGWTCWVGLRHLSIDERGDIFTAQCHWRQPLGNIISGEIKLPQKPIVCGAERCHCHPYIGIKKTRQAV